jgi:hypothetical protein
MVDVLVLLCHPWQRFPQGLLPADDDAGKKPEYDARGLVPLTEVGNICFMPADWKGAAGAPDMFAWAHLAAGSVEYWVNILKLAAVDKAEIAALRADVYKKGKREAKWHFIRYGYFCRLVRVNHDSVGEDPELENEEGEVDLTAKGVSVMVDGQVIDDSISGARVVGDTVIYGHKSDEDSRTGSDVRAEDAAREASTSKGVTRRSAI